MERARRHAEAGVNFRETPLPGVFLIDPDRREDERGFFARTYCAEEFSSRGLETRIAQCSVSFNPKRGTLRGMHLQMPPHAEVKLVRCTRGAVYDVVVDMRGESPTLGRWFAAELTGENRTMLYIPERVAHGFLTLTDDTEVSYQISEFYHPECARGVRWDDPAVGIQWPFSPTMISPRDTAFPLLLPEWRRPEESERI